MKVLTKLSALFVLSLGVLSGCAQTSSSLSSSSSSAAVSSSSVEASSSSEEIVSSSEIISSSSETIVDYAALALQSTIIVNDSTGTKIMATTTPLLYASGVDLMKTVTIAGTDRAHVVTLTWVPSDTADWTLTENPDNTTYTIATPVRPLSNAEDKVVSWTVTATETTFTAEATYHLTLVKMTVEDEFGLPLTPLSEIRSKPNGTKLRTQGYVTAIYPDGNGFYIAEGTSGVFIYYGTGVVLGNYVSVTGVTSVYAGLTEISRKSATDPLIVKVIPNPTSPLPEATVVTEANWNATALLGKDGALVHVEGMTYLSGTITLGSHSTITFKLGATNISCYSNYHTGSANQQTIKDMIAGLVAGDTLTYDGLLLWYNAPQLGPINASNFTVVHAS